MNDQLHALAALPQGEPPPPRTHWIGGWVGPRAGLDVVEKRNLSNRDKSLVLAWK
jgi:hypothetical protein